MLAVLGAADADLVFGAVDAVAAGDQREALLAAARLAESGRDLGRFFTDLEAHARGLMVVQTLGEVPAELRVTTDQDERLAEQARRVSPGTVVRLIELIAAALRAMKDGADARTQLELALLKAAAPAYDPTVKALLARIERLEGRGGGAPPPAPSLPRSPAEPATAAGRTSVAVSAQLAGQPPVAAATSVPGTPEGGQEQASAMAEQTAAAVSAELATETDPEPAVSAVAVVEPDAPAPSGEGLIEVWPAVLQTLQEQAPDLAAVLETARPARVGDGELTLAWTEPVGLFLRKVEDPVNKDKILQVIRAVTGSSVRLAYEIRADGDPAQLPKISEEELVNRFVQEFDAEVLPDEEPS